MANGMTARRADLFDSLTESGPLTLTCMTSKSWEDRAGRVDRILWHLADSLSRDQTARRFKLDRAELDALIIEAGDTELARIV
jgi:hypothetical protein